MNTSFARSMDGIVQFAELIAPLKYGGNGGGVFLNKYAAHDATAATTTTTPY